MVLLRERRGERRSRRFFFFLKVAVWAVRGGLELRAPERVREGDPGLKTKIASLLFPAPRTVLVIIGTPEIFGNE